MINIPPANAAVILSRLSLQRFEEDARESLKSKDNTLGRGA